MPTYLLEIGTEELPASFVSRAIEQWQEKIPSSLEEEYLTLEDVELYGTPRRLAVIIKGIPERQSDRTEEIKGPPIQIAYKDGKPTKALAGFAHKQGVELDQIEVRDTKKGEFIFVEKKIIGRSAQEILKELTPQWITKLEGKRFMRWGDGDLRFPRPIRSIVALLDDEILPVELKSGSILVKSDRITTGHRILHRDPVSIPTAIEYVECLRKAYIEVDPTRRKEKIVTGIGKCAAELGGVADISAQLLAEVVNLVEWPTAVVGKFDEEFLKLPLEVITTVMVTHQRYFPVMTAENSESLLPNFITISNGDPQKSDIIAAGNARVIRARLADAKFFYSADTSEHLESYLPQLENVTFQKDLGTMHDKVDRIIEIARSICNQLDIEEAQQSEIESTALLCKADLVTQMVYEFPELQGIMGEKYALVSGEKEVVAKGIFDHYLPRNAGDIMPKTITGQVVGIADRLDTIVSIFGNGGIPSGSSDPFGLRRSANAIISITWDANLDIDLQQLISESAGDFVRSHPDTDSPLTALEEFFLQRIKTLLQDELKIDYDLVNAVLGENDPEYRKRALEDLLDARDRALFLQEIRKNGKLNQIYETVNRSTRLAAQGDLNTEELDPKEVVKEELFEKDCEREFSRELGELFPKTLTSQAERNYQLLVDDLAKIAPVVSNFFDGPESVLVMDKNPEIKQNRLNLLGLLRNHARVLADFGAIVKD